MSGIIDGGSAVSPGSLPQIAALLGPFAPAPSEVGVVNQAWTLGDLRRYGGDPTGTAASDTALANADTSAQALNVPILVMGGGYRLAGAPTVTAPVTILGTGHFIVAAGQKPTINGALTAPLTRLFDVSALNSGFLLGPGSTPVCYPQWWGATTAAADNTVAFVAARDAALNGPRHIHITTGSWKVALPSPFVPGDTRGFKITGNDRRSSVLLNISTTGGDGLVIGDPTLVNATYDIVLRDFKVEGNGAYTDGRGIVLNFVLDADLENLFTEFTGRDGLFLETSFVNTLITFHARRAGFASSDPAVGGLHCHGTTGHNFINLVLEECSVGVRGVDCGIDGIKIDTENCLVAGMKITGASNLRVYSGYAETANNWLIGDGVTTISDVHLIGCDFGAAANLVLNNVQYYNLEDCTFRYPYQQIQVVDPAFTKGDIGRIFGSFQDVSPFYYTFNHIPAARASGSILRNGGFETHTDLSHFPPWSLTIPSGDWAGTIAADATDVSGHDDGLYSIKVVGTVYTVGSGLRFNYTGPIELIAGKMYTLEFSYKTTVNNGLTLTLTSGGVNHANGYQFPASAAWTRVSFKFKAQGALNNLLFFFAATGTIHLDSMNLYEGEAQQRPVNGVDTFRTMEMSTFRNVAAATGANVKAAQQVYTNVAAFDAQPDTPRVLTVTTTAGSAAGTLSVSGIDWKGQYVTDAIAIVAGGIATGAVAFMQVQLATGYDAGAGHTASIGISNTIGLPKRAIAVQKGKRNAADLAVPALDTTYNTLALAAVAGGDDFTFWYKL